MSGPFEVLWCYGYGNPADLYFVGDFETQADAITCCEAIMNEDEDKMPVIRHNGVIIDDDGEMDDTYYDAVAEWSADEEDCEEIC